MNVRGRSAVAVAVAALAPASLAAFAVAPAAALPLEPPVQVARGLVTPWAIEAPWQDRLFVTERSSATANPSPPPRIRVLAPGAATIDPTPVFTDPTPGIVARKFLGFALHPQYRQNRFAYLYETYTRDGVPHSRILRLRDECTTLQLDRVVFDGIDSDLNHDGGRIAFGPDGKLYVTTGDIHQPSRPRDPQNLNGKILRLEAPGDDRDGTAPADNPFVAQGGNAAFVWSLGHRHPQGLAWDAAGRLWESEHGPTGEGHAPTGAKQGRDELNLIVKGGDYGWPTVAGEMAPVASPWSPSGLTSSPKWQSGEPPAAAPGGLAFGGDGILYMPMLNGHGVRTFTPDAGGDVAVGDVLYLETYGRMRTATATVDGLLWLGTDDGRLLRTRVANPALPSVAFPPCAPSTPDTPDTPGTPDTPTPPVTPPGGGDPVTPAAPGTPGTTPGPSLTTPGAPGAAGTPVPSSTRPEPVRTPRNEVAALLHDRGATSLRALGLRGLLRRGAFTARVGGLGSDRAVVRLLAGKRTVARGTARPGSRATVAVRVRLTAQGRRLLRGRSTARLTLRTDVIGSGASLGAVRRTTVTLKR